MELRQLRYFVAVAETGNISKAAQRIFLTQPALSRQIKALEEEVGQCLLERKANSVRLTPAGEAMLAEAREILRMAEGAIERVRSASAGRLRIGYAPSLASGLLSPAVASFTQAHEGTRVELYDLNPGEMIEGIEAGSLDVVVTVEEENGPRSMTWIPLTTSEWRLAVGPGSPLARKARVTPHEVAREPLLVYRLKEYPGYWESVGGWMKEHGVRARISGEYDGAESLVAAVEAGLGVALVNTRMSHLFPNRVRLKPLTVSPRAIRTAAGFRTDRSNEKPLAVFIEELRRAAKAIE